VILGVEMNLRNGEQRFDEDILKCKEEILRLRGLVPPLGRPPKHEPLPPADKPAVRQTPLHEPVKAHEPEPAKTHDISASDRLYSELQEPAPISEPVIEPAASDSEPQVDRPEEITQQRQELPIAETEAAVEEIAPPQKNNGEKLETEIYAGDIDEKEEFRPDSDNILAAIEREVVKAMDDEPEPENEPEIPEFDLAQQIMAEQRKIAGNRRKKPATPRFPIKEEKPRPAENSQSPNKNPAPAVHQAPMSPQQRVIAEIVTRDIKKFYQNSKANR
jgi:hypothetical protein